MARGMKARSGKSPGFYYRGGSAVLDKRVRGQRIYESLGPVKPVEAEQILAKRIAAVLEGKYLPEHAARSLTVGDVLNDYWEQHLRYKWWSVYAKPNLDRLHERLGHLPVAGLKRVDIDSYKRARFNDDKKNRCKGKVGPRTVQKELQTLSMAVNFAVDNGKLPANTIRRFITVKQPRRRKRVFDDGRDNGPQWLKFLAAAAKRLRPMVIVLYETGMRPVHMFRMHWNWLQEKAPDRWVIEVPADADKELAAFEIPVSLRLLALFREMGIRDTDELVFPAPRKGGERDSIESGFTLALKRAGLTGLGLSPYALRRTRLSIWDAIDSNASKYASGHVPEDVHSRDYVVIPLPRLLRLVGLKYGPRKAAAKAA